MAKWTGLRSLREISLRELMERGVWVAVWLFLFLATTQIVTGAEPSGLWRSDFKAALAEAEEKQLPLLVHFYADWCIPCQRMERTTFADPAVRDALSSRFVAVKLNSDRNQDVVLRYGVETLPSDLVIDSVTGKILLLKADFMDRPRYLAMLLQAETRFQKFHVAKHSPSPEDHSSSDNAPVSALLAGNTEAELGDPRPVVGLDGFSPVTLAKQRKWVRGSAKYSWDYKDVTYQMASREELVEFRNAPENYAPKLLGCDPVILWETDRAVAGEIEFGAFFDGELYLFKTDERRNQFKVNPDKYMKLQHALKLDQVERTATR